MWHYIHYEINFYLFNAFSDNRLKNVIRTTKQRILEMISENNSSFENG